MSKTKKYKLKKWYPSLPDEWKGEEGLIVDKTDAEYYCHPYKPLGTGIGIEANEVENNPDFWEKVEEKDYEILSFKNTRPINDERIVKLRANGKYWFFDDDVHDGFTEQQMLHEGACVDSGDFIIYSVRRKSDGEVFTIGDKVKGRISSATFIINEFELFKGDVIAFAEGTQNAPRVPNFYLKNLEHIKEPLFTTEDGVDIYEGNEYYLVPHWNIMRRVASGKYIPSNKLVFGSRKRAEEYVEEHKPRYSKADIRKAAKRAYPCKSGLTFWGNINTLTSELEKPGSMQ